MNLKERFKAFFTSDRIEALEKKIAEMESQKDEKEEPVYVEPTPVPEKLIKSTRFDVNSGYIDIILSDGDVLSGTVNEETYERIKLCTDKDGIIALLKNEKKKEVEIQQEEVQKQEIVSNLVDILKNNPDFDVIGNNVYLKGVKNVEIPKDIVAEFIRLQEENLYNTEEYSSLLMFTRWLLLNPIESAREDCLTFVKENDIKLTKNGLLQCYRRVVSKKQENEGLVSFISESYFKVKRWKKSPKNYIILEDGDIYSLSSLDFKDDGEAVSLGNLSDLYQNLHNLQEEAFTDAHTNTKNIKLGAIYKEDEDKIDLDNTKDCSSGLHVGAKNFGFSGFGDVGVLALVNPMYVRSVPVSDAHKMRVSEMFVCCTMEKEDYDNLEDILDFSEEYCNSTIEELDESLKNKSFEKISCQENVPVLTIKEVENITEILKNRIITV